MRTINSTENSGYKFLKLINVISIIIFFIWYITPFFRAYFYGTFFNIIIIGLIVIWIFTAILLNPSWFFQWNFHLIIVSIQLLTFILMALWGYGGNALAYMKIGVSFWFTLYIFHFYAILGWNKIISQISIVLLISLFITSITTLVGLNSIPNASRMLTASSTLFEENKILNIKNIGGFDFIYGLIILLPAVISILIAKVKTQKNIYIKIFYSFFVILIFYIVLNSSFTIALFSLILATISGLMSRMNSQKIILIFISLSLVYILIPKEIIGVYFNEISYSVDNTYTSERINEVGDYLRGTSNDSGHLLSRTSLYDMSLGTFMSHPITGIGPYYYVNGVGIGYHSQILDDLARYGLFGFLFYVLFFYSYCKFVNKRWKDIGYNVNFLAPLLVFLFISLLNPTFSSQTISVIIFFLIPALPETTIYLSGILKKFPRIVLKKMF